MNISTLNKTPILEYGISMQTPTWREIAEHTYELDIPEGKLIRHEVWASIEPHTSDFPLSDKCITETMVFIPRTNLKSTY